MRMPVISPGTRQVHESGAGSLQYIAAFIQRDGAYPRETQLFTVGTVALAEDEATGTAGGFLRILGGAGLPCDKDWVVAVC
jgi:hypothetical protein